MAKNTYKKRNYLKSLPRVGGTVAMTMALAAALAVPAQATEVEGEIVNQEPVTPVADVPTPASVAVELPETNEAVEQENNEIVSDNQDVVEDYNNQVDDYNNAADEYNQGVNDYNDAADAYDDKAAADHQQAVEEHEQAVEDRKEEQKEYDEVTLPNWEAQNEAYAEYRKAWNEFLESEKYYYETVVPNYEAEKQAHQDKVTAFDNYQAALDAWKIKYDAYMEQYNSENTEAKDQALLEYNQALQEFNDAKKIYTESVAKEEQIYQEVQDYNKDITEKNEQIAEKNEDLKQDINSNYAENLGATEGNEGVEVDAATKTTLEGYQTLVQTQAALEQEAAQLDSHPGKSFGLDTAEYAAYLAAVEAHNMKVNEFNNAVDAYNNAIDIYNKAVEDFNARQEAEEDIFVDTSNSTGTADWGNISINQNTYFNHIDVKYAAAVSQDKLMDENGNPVTDGEDSYSKYTVTGVYTDAAAAERDSDRYGVSYRNDSNDRTQTHYIESLPEHHEFGHPSHTGARLDPETGEISFYVRLVDEQTREEYGITVNMDAASTYPPGTYYKAIGTDKLSSFRDSNGNPLQTVEIDNEEYFDISGQSVFVISALTCDGMSQWGWNGSNLTLNPNGLDLVLNMQTLIEIHKSGNAQKLGYVNYSYGKTAHNGEVREKEYTEGDPGEFDWTDLPCNPPDFDSEVVEKPDPFDKELPPPPEFKGEYVENPGERPNRPGDYEGTAPEAPKPTVRLDTLEMLEKLYGKVIVTWTLEDPTPGETPENPAPWAIPAHYYEVEAENDGPVRTQFGGQGPLPIRDCLAGNS